MRFIDEVHVHVASGKGGDGAMSFRREKYVPFGGPDGGDGGRGGEVRIVASTGKSTLLELRSNPIWRAKDGERGGSRQMTGADGDDTIIEVPLGTRVYDEGTGGLVGDLVNAGDTLIAAKGGDGGFGNLRYKTSTNRAPRKTTPGWPGQERRLRLELMLMADVGLLGFPNAGKSTLISRISAARPKVADYPFTTLVPNLGVVDMGTDGSFVVADIPGLVEGAAEGVGLGHRFLRHVARTRLLLHLLSLSPDEELPPEERYDIIRAELGRFDASLLERPEIIVLTKLDTMPPEAAKAAYKAVRRAAPDRRVLRISAVTGLGLPELKALLFRLVQELPVPELPAPNPALLSEAPLPAEAPLPRRMKGVTPEGVEWEYALSAEDELDEEDDDDGDDGDDGDEGDDEQLELDPDLFDEEEDEDGDDDGENTDDEADDDGENTDDEADDDGDESDDDGDDGDESDDDGDDGDDGDDDEDADDDDTDDEAPPGGKPELRLVSATADFDEDGWVDDWEGPPGDRG